MGWHDRALSSERTMALARRLFGEDVQQVRRTLDIPGKRTPTTVTAALVDPGVAAEAFEVQRWVPWRTLSPSLGWTAAVAALAAELVGSGRVIPAVDAASARTTWIPALDPSTTRSLVALTEAMPPVFGALHADEPAWQLTSRLLDAFVDDAVRLRLWGAGAGGPTERDHRPVAVMARRVLSALCVGPDVAVNNDAERLALEVIADEIDRWSSPLSGRSPLADVTVFARLQPDDTDHREGADGTDHDEGSDEDGNRNSSTIDKWNVELFVAPDRDPSLYLSAEWVWQTTRKARDAPEFDVDGAQRAIRYVHRRLQVASPTLALAFDETHPAVAKLSMGEVLQVVHHDLDAIKAAGLVVQLPAWWVKPSRARVIGHATPTDPVVASGMLTAKSLVAINWVVVLGGEVLTEDELKRLAKSKYELLTFRGRWTVIDRDQVAAALTAVTRLRREAPITTAIGLLALDADTDRDIAELTGDGWAHELLGGLPDDRLVPVEEPPGFVGHLRPYQQRGVGWLAFLSRLGLGGVLADDMGLGKTVQVLALLAHEGTGPTLLICPLSVVHNWETESARFVPSLRVAVHHGVGRTADAEFDIWVKNVDLVITTYATATRDAATLARTTWERVVVDEAQHVKNHHTLAAKAIRTIPARQRLALTGTPVENRLADLWSVMDLVNPGVLGSPVAFRRSFAVPIELHRDPAVTARLHTRIGPLLLRRSKTDRSLVPELPDKIETTAWATLTHEQASLYRAVVDTLFGRISELKGIDRRGAIVATITRLKQICNHPVHYLGDGGRLEGRSGKLTRLDQLLDDAFDTGDRVIAFTQYVAMGDLVQRHLATRLSMDVPFLHGGLTKRRRDTMVGEFQDGRVPLLLVSLKAGGSGLNLTAAGQVIHIDRWWNPAVEDQASDRAWRIGQAATVLVHKLATRGTIEERIDKLIAEKRDLADRVLSSGDRWITELSTDDLRQMLSLDDQVHRSHAVPRRDPPAAIESDTGAKEIDPDAA